MTTDSRPCLLQSTANEYNCLRGNIRGLSTSARRPYVKRASPKSRLALPVRYCPVPYRTVAFPAFRAPRFVTISPLD